MGLIIVNMHAQMDQDKQPSNNVTSYMVLFYCTFIHLLSSIFTVVPVSGMSVVFSVSRMAAVVAVVIDPVSRMAAVVSLMAVVIDPVSGMAVVVISAGSVEKQ